jgi:hypothetical protein
MILEPIGRTRKLLAPIEPNQEESLHLEMRPRVLSGHRKTGLTSRGLVRATHDQNATASCFSQHKPISDCLGGDTGANPW